jgi:hypothetical protein
MFARKRRPAGGELPEFKREILRGFYAQMVILKGNDAEFHASYPRILRQEDSPHDHDQPAHHVRFGPPTMEIETCAQKSVLYKIVSIGVIAGQGDGISPDTSDVRLDGDIELPACRNRDLRHFCLHIARQNIKKNIRLLIRNFMKY